MVYKEFQIRPARNEDIPDIKNVVFGVLREYRLFPSETGKDNDLSDIEQYYFNKGGYFGVAVNTNSNEIVGTFGLYKVNNDVCELRKMYLLKKVRGKGLGKCILTYAIQVGIEKHYKKIILETITPLKEAISLYKKRGFVEIIPSEINERVDQAFELILL
jgi:putative acetyltransferase